MTSSEVAEEANLGLEGLPHFGHMLDASVLVQDEGQALDMAHFYSAIVMYLTSVHRLLWWSGCPSLLVAVFNVLHAKCALVLLTM